MLPPIEKIKQGILHAEQDVRNAAIHYFSRSRSADPSVMPLAIQAIAQYGPDAFRAYGFMADLVQTDDTVAWLIEEIQRCVSVEDQQSSRYSLELHKALLRADAECLQRHEVAIASLRELDPLDKELISNRIRVRSLPPEDLWEELIDLCARIEVEQEEYPPEGYDLACSIVQSLARHPEHCAHRVLPFLTRNDESDDDEVRVTWLDAMLVRLAGDLKLEAALPVLVERIEYSDYIDADEAHEALTRIGSEAAVRELVAWYAEADWFFRSAIIEVLGTIPTDASLQACRDLLDAEDDADLQGFLLCAALDNFSAPAIELARQHILANSEDLGLMDVRSSLLVACSLLEISFPEYEAWLEESRHDAEFQRQWPEEDWDVEDPDFDGESLDDDDDGLDVEEDYQAESITIVRGSAKIGRNDPCPCGSGKKFKKCCYGKEDVFPELQELPASAMSSLRQQQFPIGTVATYGPDDKTITKIVAGVIKQDGAEPILMRWVGTSIGSSPKAQRELRTFFEKHKVKSVATSPGNLGCPHEEGPDFPIGEDCPFCPFWAGKQGSNRRDG